MTNGHVETISPDAAELPDTRDRRDTREHVMPSSGFRTLVMQDSPYLECFRPFVKLLRVELVLGHSLLRSSSAFLQCGYTDRTGHKDFIKIYRDTLINWRARQDLKPRLPGS